MNTKSSTLLKPADFGVGLQDEYISDYQTCLLVCMLFYQFPFNKFFNRGKLEGLKAFVL